MKLDSALIGDLISALKRYSPVIATAIGGPYGGLIATLLCHVFKLDPSSTDPSQLSSTIQADPDASLKLTQFQYEHETALDKIWSTNYSTEVQDRINAREENNESKYGWVVHVLSGIIILGFICSLLGIMVTKSTNQDDQHILTMMFGILGATFGQVIAYYYGSMRRVNVK